MKNPKTFHEKCSVVPTKCKRAKPLFHLLDDDAMCNKELYQYDEGSCEDCDFYEMLDENGLILDEWDSDEGVDFNYGTDNW